MKEQLLKCVFGNHVWSDEFRLSDHAYWHNVHFCIYCPTLLIANYYVRDIQLVKLYYPSPRIDIVLDKKMNAILSLSLLHAGRRGLSDEYYNFVSSYGATKCEIQQFIKGYMIDMLRIFVSNRLLKETNVRGFKKALESFDTYDIK